MIWRRILLLFFLFVISIPTGSVIVLAEDLQWEVISPGIEYQKYQLSDPNNIFVVRMDRTKQDLILESSIAQGTLSQGRESVSGMASRYDQALNYWGGSSNPPTWGMRNKVVVAINGSYFDWNTGVPEGGQTQSGWYVKRYTDFGGWSGFAWKVDRSLFIGDCLLHKPEKQVLAIPEASQNLLIGDINDPPKDGELVIFTPQFNSRTGTADPVVEVLVEMTRPTMVLPQPAYASGTVRQIFASGGNHLIPFNSIVIAAKGSAADALLQNIHLGSEIRLSQEITSFDADCSTPNSLSWTKTYSSIQGAFFFLKNGQIRDFDDPGATERNPRTAIAYNDQYIYFIVVDGRDRVNSIGMTIHQLAFFARDTLGATSAVAQDGGGSSTLVINGKVINNTFCNIYSCMAKYRLYLPLVNHNGQAGQPSLKSYNDEIVQTAAGTERLVGNGMLMVIVEPEKHSSIYTIGDAVKTSSETNLRLGPGTNYAGFTTIPANSNGLILAQMNGLNGVLAKGSYWWYVDFGGMAGWVQEAILVK